jgi:4-carboxymuconolactone decarboxylase
MAKEKLPKHYLFEKKTHEAFIGAVEALGKTLREQGPLDEKTANLIQLAAAAAIHSEGAVHSHVRRAVEGRIPIFPVKGKAPVVTKLPHR